MTPAKMFLLMDVHNKLNSIPDEKEAKKIKKQEAKPLTLQEALAWAKS